MRASKSASLPGHADGVVRAEVGRHLFFEALHRRAENELLRLQDLIHGLADLRPQPGVLGAEVDDGDLIGLRARHWF
jgi:hypothetical protein